MRLSLSALAFVLLVASFANHVLGDDEDGDAAAAKKKAVKKLQIGVKKRVEDCKMRSRRGDSLHMHYTVS